MPPLHHHGYIASLVIAVVHRLSCRVELLLAFPLDCVYVRVRICVHACVCVCDLPVLLELVFGEAVSRSVPALFLQVCV